MVGGFFWRAGMGGACVLIAVTVFGEATRRKEQPPPPLKVSVNPRVGFAPLPITVTVTNIRGRAIKIAAVCGEDVVQGTTRAVDMAITQLRWTLGEPCDYLIGARTYDQNEQQLQEGRTTVEVK